jgi:hypothetical protein
MMLTALRLVFLAGLVGSVVWLAYLGWLGRDDD